MHKYSKYNCTKLPLLFLLRVLSKLLQELLSFFILDLLLNIITNTLVQISCIILHIIRILHILACVHVSTIISSNIL